MLSPGALFHARRQPCTLMRSSPANTQGAAFWRVFEQRGTCGRPPGASP
ncbi:uncharacterized protein SOCE836_079840 [Sorangium cellulosum]|uniref:Uncharacterized protein n=1 Tax=Sorangium cellulosum TaxID=56 RepID=A0A4P2QZ31_SORCE|nr:uncharacterized protein SOCE836_079840 [Sorangium cellulosum]